MIRIPPLIYRLALTAGGTLLALLLAELLLRVAVPDKGMGSARELVQFRTCDDFRDLFVVDPDFGFRPVLGNRIYNDYGTLHNGYTLEKSDGVERLLFIGDSVTARGRLMAALQRHYGCERYEYWNAGVESFNTIQEVAFYRRFNAPLRPDHVILTFHLNDFGTTPVAFRSGPDRLTVYEPNFPARELNARLYRLSYIYRFVLGISKRGNRHIDAATRETGDALRQLRDELARDGIALSVLVLPFLRPSSTWSPGDCYSHRLICTMLSDLNIRHFTLLGVVEQAIADGVDVQETEGDDWHPSQAAADRFAAYLVARGLFE